MLDSVRMALIITRREIRDQFRDWRIIFPVVVLTLIFPGLMNFTAQQAIKFVERYDAPIVAERLIPFLLMIVGFFPISVSLVIALDSFVGEKERRSIEPLLCSPLTDNQLYFGKLFAAMTPPLLASYLGVAVYVTGLFLQIRWTPSPLLLIQILLLTTVQAFVMVSGAVVVSSQTTSVRAANLLASFIIIPMALLIQGEAIVMFWARYNILWWVIIGQVIIAGLLVRTGISYFNREELLGRELDTLNLKWIWQQIRLGFTGDANGFINWYIKEIPASLRELRLPIYVTVIALGIGFFAGIHLAGEFRLPIETFAFNQVNQGFLQELVSIRFMSSVGAGMIWLHNIRAIAIASILGLFSFGVLGLLIEMLPIAIIGYIAGNIAYGGLSPLAFLTALVLPHGIIEIPAIILTGAATLNLGVTLITPTKNKTIGESMLLAIGKWARIMVGVIIPLFLLAALIEVFVTPHIAVLILNQ